MKNKLISVLGINNKELSSHLRIESGTNRIMQILHYAVLLAIVLIVLAANYVVFSLIDNQLEHSRVLDDELSAWEISHLDLALEAYTFSLKDAINSTRDLPPKDPINASMYEKINTAFNTLRERTNTLASHQDRSSLAFLSTPEWASIAGQDGLIAHSQALITPSLNIASVKKLLREVQSILQSSRDVIFQAERDAIAIVKRNREEFRASLQTLSAIALGLLGVKSALIVTIYLQGRLRERQRNELAQAVYNLRLTVDSSLEATVVLDHGGRVIGCNKAGAEMFGWEEEAQIIRYLSDVLRDVERGENGLKNIVRSCTEAQGRITMTGYRANGQSFPVEISLVFTRNALDAPIAIGFMRDISEQVEREDVLREARNAAQEGEKVKSRFLAIMSHEMLTPLNGLLSAADLLTSGSRLTKEQRQLIDIIEGSAKITLEQVNNMLDMTHLVGTGKGWKKLKETAFSMDDLLHTATAHFDAQARQNGNTFSLCFSGEPKETLIYGRQPIVMRVVMNLLSNAVKFTENGQITVSADMQPGRSNNTLALRISITDTGIGIAAEELDRIFNMFETLDASYTRRQEGSGLGLGLAKLAAEELDGRITAKSVPGKGSTFSFFLTLKIAKPSENQKGATHPQIQNNVANTPPPQAFSLLIVEDNHINRELLAKLLRRKGHVVFEAQNGSEGVTMANENHYDAILMDIAMPVMDGIEATQRIRNGNGASKNTTIIAVTANADHAHQSDFISAGMNDILGKPVDIRKIEATLKNTIPTTAIESIKAPKKASLPPQNTPVRKTSKNTKKASKPDIDEAIVKDLEEALGKDYIAKMIKRLIAETNAGMDDMDDSARNGDLNAAAEAAHKVAGAVASVGLRELHALFADYEHNARTGVANALPKIRQGIEKPKEIAFSYISKRWVSSE